MDIRRALIVDDSKLVCFQLSKILKDKGIASQAVHSGEDAITYLGNNPLPDVIFIDIMMPGMDGYQTTEAIRANPKLAQLPIIMCSSNDTDDDRAQAQQRGANGFLPKPPTPEQITKAFATLTPVAKPVPPPSAPRVETKFAPESQPPNLDELTRQVATALASEITRSVTRELTEKFSQTLKTFLESDAFRNTINNAAQNAAEKNAPQIVRAIRGELR